MDRNLVLLLASGHTVKIALKPDDLPTTTTDVSALHAFVRTLPAVPFIDWGQVAMAFIEDMAQATVDEEPNEFQRIDAYAPGEAL